MNTKQQIQIMSQLLLIELAKANVTDFLRLMRELNCSGDYVIIPGLKHRDRLYVWELNDTALAPILASEINCTFYGGPPKSRQMYKGTLLNILIDRILTTTLVKDDMSIINKIYTQAPFDFQPA